MSIRSLADFVENLDAARQLCRVSASVSTDQEVSGLVHRVAQQHGPALVFQNLAQSRMAVAANLLGTEHRIALALGAVSLEAVTARLPGAAPAAGNGGWLGWLKAGFQAGIEGFAPRAVRTAACQQVVRLGRDVELSELPAIKLAPQQAHAWLLGACVVSGTEEGDRALGQFDLIVHDQAQLAIRWGPRDPIAAQFARCRAAGQKLSLAVLLGAAPVITIAAAATVREPELDPYLLAGLLAAEPVDLVTCRTIPVQVPAEADLVIEATIDPQSPPLADVPAGTCGGFRLPPSEAYPIQVSALTQRANPLASAIVPHAPPNEACALAQAITRLWLPATRRLIPSLMDVALPMAAIAGQMAVLAIRKEHPGQAAQAAAAWWGQPATATTKVIVVVDAEADVHSPANFWSEVAAQADPARDMVFFDGPIDHRDFSSPATGVGRRLLIDATSKLAGERSYPCSERLNLPEDQQQRIDELLRSLELDT